MRPREKSSEARRGGQRRARVRVRPPSQTRECVPGLGPQPNLTQDRTPSAFMRKKVLTWKNEKAGGQRTRRSTTRKRKWDELRKHHSKRSRNFSIGSVPHEHVSGFAEAQRRENGRKEGKEKERRRTKASQCDAPLRMGIGKPTFSTPVKSQKLS